MPRLFIAIDLPPDRTDAVAALRDDRVDARWTPVDQYHVTLRFIGDAEEETVEALRKDLRAVDVPAFSMSGSGLDVFPSRRRPRVLVARMSMQPELEKLREEIEAVVLRHGFDPERKPFNPHLTFARVKRGSPRDVRQFLKANGGLTLAPFPVTEFHLYRSDLQAGGAEHTVLESYGLG